MKSRIILLLSFLLSTLCTLSVAQTGTGMESTPGGRRFTTLDGLPQMLTETVWQDSRGYIYIGTLSGFVRYDGKTMTPFLGGQRENIVGFQEVDGKVRAMGFVRQWILNGKQVKMEPVDPEGQLLLNNYNSPLLPQGNVLLEDRQEKDRALFSITRNGRKRVFSSGILDQMTPDRKMYVDSNSIYIPTPQGLYVADGPQVRRLSGKKDVFSLIRHPIGLLAFSADGIYRVQADSLILLLKHPFDAPDYGLSLCPDRHGRLFIADSHTIWVYDACAPVPMRRLATGFNLIKHLFTDCWNRLWVATYQGVYCFFQGHFTNHRLEDRNDIVRAISVCGGKLVMGTLNGSVLSDGELIETVENNYFQPGTAVLGDKVYMAGNGDIAYVQEDALHWLGLPYERYQFVSRRGGDLIIGTRSNILVYHPENGHTDTLTVGIVHPWCAAEDGSGHLWVSGNPGLYLMEETAEGGTSVTKVLDTPSTQIVSAITSDRKGRVCFARGDHMFAILNGEIQPMEETDAILSGHEIRSVHLSSRGYLVVATVDGILVAGIAEPFRAVNLHWYNALNGFTLIEPQLGPMAEEEDGTIWLAGLEEMTSFKPEELLKDSVHSTIIKAPLPWWRQWWDIMTGL